MFKYYTIALISHDSKIMAQNPSSYFPTVCEPRTSIHIIGFRKCRVTRDQIVNICYIKEKAREFQKIIYFCFTDYTKAFDCVKYNKLWKMLKEIKIPDHLICLLRNLYAGQEATVRTGHGTMDGSKLGMELSTARLYNVTLVVNLYAEYIMWNARLDEAQA